jgi:hypothetical protein
LNASVAKGDLFDGKKQDVKRRFPLNTGTNATEYRNYSDAVLPIRIPPKIRLRLGYGFGSTYCIFHHYCLKSQENILFKNVNKFFFLSYRCQSIFHNTGIIVVGSESKRMSKLLLDPNTKKIFRINNTAP